jgi:hypothetical protein
LPGALCVGLIAAFVLLNQRLKKHIDLQAVENKPTLKEQLFQPIVDEKLLTDEGKKLAKKRNAVFVLMVAVAFAAVLLKKCNLID